MAARAAKLPPRLLAAAGTVLLMALLLAAAAPAVRGVSCVQVLGLITPCISYASGKSDAPGEACCAGISKLNNMANTTATRQATCKCLKQVTAAMPGLKPDIVAGIPSKCGVDVPYPIRKETDCSKVQ